MALEQWRLYDEMTPAYGLGAEDTGLGVGMKGPSPGFPTWKASDALPNGAPVPPIDYWAHDGYFFLVTDANDSIFRFAIDADGNLTPDGSVTMGGMGLVGTVWNYRKCAWYDETDGSVILLSRIATGTGSTPQLGKWLCSKWPFTNVNAEWLSPLQFNYGSFVSGQFTNFGIGMFNATTQKFYLSSLNSGQIARVDTTDGSVDGFWEPHSAYSHVYPMGLHGFDASNRPVVGGYLVAESSGHTYSWDDSDPASWTKVTQLLKSSDVPSSGQPDWNRVQGAHYFNVNRMYPLTPTERAMLSLNDRCAWWVAQRTGDCGEYMLVTFVPIVDGEYQNRTVAHAAERRAVPNTLMQVKSFAFARIDGYAWFVGYNSFTLDQENEDPGGNQTYHKGLCLTPIGPVDIGWSGSAPLTGTPKQITIDIDPAAVNYLHSDSYGKHQFRIRVTPIATGIPGPWSNWRSGKQPLNNLDVVVDGKDIWPSWVLGDTVEIEHQMCAGWPYQWDSVSGNPGEIGDPSTPSIGTADVAPPRECLPVLHYEPTELGGGLL